jgi:serine acetyltransferase
MSSATLFDTSYEKQKRPLLNRLLGLMRPIYSPEELDALRIDPVSRGILSQRSGRGFVNRDLLETVLGNLLECAAPGSHNATESGDSLGFEQGVEEIADQLYAMIAQSLIAVEGPGADVESRAIQTTFSLLGDLPRFKDRARWNRFASLKDPAVWDAYISTKNNLCLDDLATVDFKISIDTAIEARDDGVYRDFLKSRELDFAFDYQMQLVVSSYPGWRVLFYHDVAHALTGAQPSESLEGVARDAVPLLPRAIAELGGRYYQADLHPETRIGDANFLEHPHRGLTTGQTGVIGEGCVIYPCTLGGISDKVRQRHPQIGDFVQIGTDAQLLGPVGIGDRSTIGINSQVYGYVDISEDCRIASTVVIGTVLTGLGKPGRIRLGKGVRVGDGTVIENSTELDLVIPEKSEIPARSHVVNDGFGNPRYLRD